MRFVVSGSQRTLQIGTIPFIFYFTSNSYVPSYYLNFPVHALSYVAHSKLERLFEVKEESWLPMSGTDSLFCL